MASIKLKTGIGAILMFVLAIVLLLGSGCGQAVPEETSAATTTQVTTTTAETTETQRIFTGTGAWQKAYIEFLDAMQVPPLVLEETGWKEGLPIGVFYTFSMRDLDNNGIPELIVDRRNNDTKESVLAIYTYDDKVYEIGEMDDPGSYASVFRFSNNPKFPGLFWLRYGGGMERYGYLSIKEENLMSEELWRDDHTTDLRQLIDISDNKALIKESMDVFSDHDFKDNILEHYLDKEELVSEIIRYN